MALVGRARRGASSRFAAATLIAIAVSAIILGGTAAVERATASAGPDDAEQDGHFPPIEERRRLVPEAVDFAVREPTWLPSGALLRHVMPHVSTLEGRRYESVDYWYALGEGRRLHIWQAAASASDVLGYTLEDDKTASNVQLANGSTWYHTNRPDMGVHVLTREFDDGVIISMSAPDLPVLERVAESLQRAEFDG